MSEEYHRDSAYKFRVERQFRRKAIRDWSTKDLYDAKVLHNTYAHGMRTRQLQEIMTHRKPVDNTKMERHGSFDGGRIAASIAARKGPLPTEDVIVQSSRYTRNSMRWMSDRMNTSQDWFFATNRDPQFQRIRIFSKEGTKRHHPVL
jgi:hypothetical protein